MDHANLILEYLDKQQYCKTAETFLSEAEELNKTNRPVRLYDTNASSRAGSANIQSRRNAYLKDALLGFDSGNVKKFWSNYHKLKSSDKNNDELEFKIQVYFTIFPLTKLSALQDNSNQIKSDSDVEIPDKNNSSSKFPHDPKIIADFSERQKIFKQYIDDNPKIQSQLLSQNPNYAVYFSLPYVQDVNATKIMFKNELEDNFRIITRKTLEDYLNKEILNSTSNYNNIPRISNLERMLNKVSILEDNSSQYEVLKKQYDQQSKILETERNRSNTLSTRMTTLQKDYHNLINIAAELVDTLETAVYGNPVSAEYLANICKRLFQSDTSVNNSVKNSQISQDLTLNGSTMLDPDATLKSIMQRPGTASSIIRQSVQHQPMDPYNQTQMMRSSQLLQNTTIQTMSSVPLNGTVGASTLISQSPSSKPLPVDSSVMTSNIITHQQPKLQVIPPSNLQPINSHALKTILNDQKYLKESPELILKTLQALRWRITKTEKPQERVEVLKQYIDNHGFLFDLEFLQVLDKGNSSAMATPIKEAYARFYNTIVSIQLGRNHLSQNTFFVHFFLKKFSQASDGVYRDHLLGILQKLSLKRKIQSALIKNGAVGILVNLLDVVEPGINPKKPLHLNESEVMNLHYLSDYALEYCTALLMNLCLRSAGRKKAGNIPTEKLLRVIKELLRHEDIEVRPYANGILYSALQVKRVWDAAKETNLAGSLTEMINDLDNEQERSGDGVQPQEVKKQFEYILKQLSKETMPVGEAKNSEDPNYDSADEDENEEADEYEEEDEEDDIIEPDLDTNDLNFGGLVGNDLLINLEKVAENPNFSGDSPVNSSSIITKPRSHSRTSNSRQGSRVGSRHGNRPEVNHLSTSQISNTSTLINSEASNSKNNSRPTSARRNNPKNNNSNNYTASSVPFPSGVNNFATRTTNPIYQESPEYASAFGSRPKVPRTPDVRSYNGRRSMQ